MEVLARREYACTSEVLEPPFTFCGEITELPAVLPWFLVPVPRGYFRRIFSPRSWGATTVYVSDAHAFQEGDILASHPLNSGVPDAPARLSWVLQVDAVSGCGKPSHALGGTIYGAASRGGALKRDSTFRTTQAAFLQFLRAGADPRTWEW